MTYPQALRYLESFINYEKIPEYPYKESLTLERIKGFLTVLGDPQDALRFIHVAGTKGKGSTCAFLTYILREAGFKAGLYTSPHLSDFRERIRILDRPSSLTPHPSLRDFEGMISKSALAGLVTRLKPVIDKYNKNSEYGPLSFFEVYTALAFVYFQEKKTDFVVLETGLGGRLDATNVVNPLVCVITPISYEHTQKLGNTLREIAGEKAGIIKSCQLPPPQILAGPPSILAEVVSCQPIVISAPQEREALDVIRNRCKEVGAKLYQVGRDIKIVHGPQTTVHSLGRSYANLKIRLLGEHQWVNAASAIGAIDALRKYDIKVDVASIRNGLYNTLWPGRCEVVAKNPLVILDGAQNSASARVLKETIPQNFKYRRLILVLGISRDKDIKGICQQLCPLADEIILTQANSSRAAVVEEIEKFISPQSTDRLPRSIKTCNIKEAIVSAKAGAGKADLILVTGSLFVVGEARSLF